MQCRGRWSGRVMKETTGGGGGVSVSPRFRGHCLGDTRRGSQRRRLEVRCFVGWGGATLVATRSRYQPGAVYPMGTRHMGGTQLEFEGWGWMVSEGGNAGYEGVGYALERSQRRATTKASRGPAAGACQELTPKLNFNDRLPPGPGGATAHFSTSLANQGLYYQIRG
eukprot:763331-Hanusia_phi.AAC.2